MMGHWDVGLNSVNFALMMVALVWNGVQCNSGGRENGQPAETLLNSRASASPSGKQLAHFGFQLWPGIVHLSLQLLQWSCLRS